MSKYKLTVLNCANYVLDIKSESPVILVNIFFPVGMSQYQLYSRRNYHHIALDPCKKNAGVPNYKLTVLNCMNHVFDLKSVSPVILVNIFFPIGMAWSPW